MAGDRRRARSPQRPPRRRRSPDVARQEILDAAERVFATAQPDQVGLKEVAHAAGVSHALITHYFGTYAGLIEAALERRIRALRGTMLQRLRATAAAPDPTELLAVLFHGLEDPVHLRLTKWLLASERPSAAHALALRERGLTIFAQQISTTLGPHANADAVHTIELALLAATAAAYGYALGKPAFAGSLGREPSRELDGEVLETVAAMVEIYLRHELGDAR